MSYVIDPLAYPFFLRAMAASSIVGLVCAVVGSYMVLRGLAFMGDALVVSGFFERARWDQLGGEAATYGDAGRIYQKGGKALGAWGNGIVVIADRAEDVRRAIDQLEGRAPVPAAVSRIRRGRNPLTRSATTSA